VCAESARSLHLPGISAFMATGHGLVVARHFGVCCVRWTAVFHRHVGYGLWFGLYWAEHLCLRANSCWTCSGWQVDRHAELFGQHLWCCRRAAYRPNRRPHGAFRMGGRRLCRRYIRRRNFVDPTRGSPRAGSLAGRISSRGRWFRNERGVKLSNG
jgi:hypothetical protein